MLVEALLVLAVSVGISDACSASCVQQLDVSSYTPGQGHSVYGPDELSCDLETDCCWNNDQAPVDQLNFRKVNAVTDQFRAQCSGVFGSALPTGNFLAFYDFGNFNGNFGKKLQFASCPVACAVPGSPVTLTARIWRSVTARVQVCTRTSTVTLDNCQAFVALSGEQTFNFPSGENFQFVILADMLNSFLDAVAIDDIRVNFEPCATTTTSTTTTAGPTTTTQDPDEALRQACDKIKCDFASDLCNWEATSNDVMKPYPAGALVGNLDTGVNALSLSGKTTMPEVSETAFMGGSPSAGLETGAVVRGLNLPDDLVMKLNYYDSCDGHHVEACFTDESGSKRCSEVSENGVHVDHRQWLIGEVIIPRGTTEIELKGKNTGSYFCSVGLNEFELIDSITRKTCRDV